MIAVFALLLVLAPVSDEQQLETIKLELWPKAYREQDVALLDRLLDDSFRLTDGEGTVTTKSDELAWVKANKPRYERFEFVIERLELYAGTSAVVSGLGKIYMKRDGKEVISKYRSTNVFIKKDGTWRAIASHTSSVPEKR